MKIQVILIVSFIICSCNNKPDIVLNINNLEGNWSNGNYSFSFQDSLCKFFNPYSDYTSFIILDDTIKCVPDRFHNIKYNIDIINFPVLSLTEETLVLKTPNYLSKNDTLSLKRVQFYSEKFLTFDTLLIHVDSHLNFIPATTLMIDNQLNIYRKQRVNIDSSEVYIGNISDEQYKTINDMIRQIKIRDMNNIYFDGNDMAHSIYFTMKLKNKKFKVKEDFFVKVAGFHVAPMELESLLYYLIYLPNYISFSKSDEFIDIWSLLINKSS